MRFLDYQKVKDAEREEAKQLFGTAKQPTELASKVMGVKSRAFDATGAVGVGVTGGDAARGGADGAQAGEGRIRVKLTEKERKRVEKMIREAKSLQEITRLEKELSEGRIPRGVIVDEGGDGDEEGDAGGKKDGDVEMKM